MNGLNHSVLEQMDDIHSVQNRQANYEKVTGFELTSRRFVIAYYIFKNKISGFMGQDLVRVVTTQRLHSIA